MKFTGVRKQYFFGLLALALIVPLGASAAPDFARSVPGQFIVKFRPNLTPSERSARRSKLKVRFLRKMALTDAQLVQADTVSTFNDSYAKELIAKGEAEYVEPNYIVSINSTPNDPRYGELWGLHNTGQSGGREDVDVDAPEAWDITTGSNSVVVGVIDTGVNYNHPDLNANMWRNPGEIAGNGIDDDGNGVIDDVYGYNAINGSGNPMDDHSHGSHCAGTIGASANNSAGVVGVAQRVRLMGLKFLDSSGSGSTDDAIKAIEYAVMMKNRGVNIRVLSNSWGGGGQSQALEESVQAANDAGLLFVAAAGNSASDNDASPSYPANIDLPNVLSVAAIDRNGNLANFSNFGVATVHVAAPGVDILSTVLGSSYGSMSGTSMATPHVSGVAALLAAHAPTLTASEMKGRLINTVKLQDSLTGLIVAPGTVSAKRVLLNQLSPLPPTQNLPAYSQSAIPAAFSTNLGMKISSLDDGYIPVDLPFSFPFFGQPYARIAVSTNGRVIPLATGELPPTAADYSNRISQGLHIYNDDLVPAAGDEGGVHLRSSADEVVITWVSANYAHRAAATGAAVVRFQMKLLPTGVAEFHYEDTDHGDPVYNFGASASVGLGPNGGVAGQRLTVTNNQANEALIGSGKALRFLFDGVQHVGKAKNDFDRDGKSDHVMFSKNVFTVLLSGKNFDPLQPLTVPVGRVGNDPLIGDYDGDGRPDLGLYRRRSSTFFVRLSSSEYSRMTTVQWGEKGDTAVVGDFDGDGRADITVFNKKSGTFFSRPSKGAFKARSSKQKIRSAITVNLPRTTDPIVADFTGSGKDGFGAIGKVTRRWTVKGANNRRLIAFDFGQRGDIPLACDYDGNGVADRIMVRKTGVGTLEWFILSDKNLPSAVTFGQVGDVPTCSGDYNGDGKADLSVYRPGNGAVQVLDTATGSVSTVQGAPGVRFVR